MVEREPERILLPPPGLGLVLEELDGGLGEEAGGKGGDEEGEPDEGEEGLS